MWALLGILWWALVVILPGAATLFLVVRPSKVTVVESLILSLVLGLAVNSVVLVGLTFVGLPFSPLTPGLLLPPSVYLLRRAGKIPTPKGILRLPSISKADKVALLVMLLQAGVVTYYFYGWPIFHRTDSIDPITHSRWVTGILETGGVEWIRGTSYPPGYHMLTALSATALTLSALSALRILAALLMVLEVGVAFYLTRTLTRNLSVSSLASLFLVFVLPSGFLHLTDSGTFPNLYADVLILTTLWLLFRTKFQTPKMPRALTIPLLGIALTLSHASVALFFTVLWVYALTRLQSKKPKLITHLRTAVLLSVGPLAALLVKPTLITRVLYVAEGAISVPENDPNVLYVQSNLPALITLGWMGAISGVAAVAITLLAVAVSLRKRTELGDWMILWFVVGLVLGAVAPDNAVRFSFIMLVPSAILSAQLLGKQIPSLAGSLIKRKDAPHKSRRQGPRRVPPDIILPLVFVILLISLSPFVAWMLSQDLGGNREKQMDVYESMSWIAGEEGDGEIRVISVALPEYAYLPVLFGDFTTKSVYSPHEVVSALCSEEGCDYVAVWSAAPFAQGFRGNPQLRHAFANLNVDVYEFRTQG